MISYISTYFVTLVTLIGLDAVFLGVVMKKFYASQFGDLMRSSIDFKYALIFYVLYTAALILFVLQPALTKLSLSNVLIMGFAFGITAYMTYDLTSAAIIKNFPVAVIIPDILWGGIITSIGSGVGYKLLVYLLKLA